MHSYAIPFHEEETGRIAEQIGFEQISISSSVMARQKIVKRGDTWWVDAYLNPHINKYIEGFKAGFDDNLEK